MRPMGRPRTRNFDLPPRVTARRLKSKILYYYCKRDGGRIPLGADPAEMRRRWAELETGIVDARLMSHVLGRYRREALAAKAFRTQKENTRQLVTLGKAFGHLSIEQVQPVHVRQYLDRRSKKIAANREIALLSHVWNWAREQGLTARPNPCAGVRKNKERRREQYATDAAYKAVWQAAPDWLRDAMDLALLTSQRPGDVLKMTRQDIHDGCLWVRQGKTGQRVGVEVRGELARVVKRLGARQIASIYLVNDNGQPVTIWKLDHAFAAARKAAGHDWQFRDLRAKAVTDEKDLRTAQRRAGHASEVTTAEIYRRVKGDRVEPLK